MSTTPTNVAAFTVETSQLQQQQEQQQEQQQQHLLHRKMYGSCRIGKVLSTAAILVALMLVIAAIYMHVIQKPHLGRLYVKLTGNEIEVDEVTLPLPYQLATEPAVAELSSPLLSDDCLECIAKTTTANKPAMCPTTPCSIYRISQPYWQDAMRQETYMGVEDYGSCVSNPDCAAATVRSFIMSYARDCDGDGVIQCQDHIMLHLLGPTGCLQKPLAALFRSRMDECLRVKELK